MKYVLIVWLLTGDPGTFSVTFDTSVACVGARDTLFSFNDKMRGICVPLGGDAKTYDNFYQEVYPGNG